MADIFLKADVRTMMKNKTVFFCGDSNMRGWYKDFVQLYTHNVLINEKHLKAKMEDSLNGDRRISNQSLTRDRKAEEHRLFVQDEIRVVYYFVTKCYHELTEVILKDMAEHPPDVVLYNSCLWDLCRWGFTGPDQFKVGLNILMQRFKEVLPEHCVVIWMTTPPISSNTIKSAFLIKQVEFMKHSMRFEIMEANLYASHVLAKHGYDCLDIHYHLRWQLHRRTEDGVHWKPAAVRYVTNLWLTHVALAWGTPLPNNFTSPLLTDAVDMVNERVVDDSTPPTHGDAVDVPIPNVKPLGARPPSRTRGKPLRARRHNPTSNGWINLSRPRNQGLNGGMGGQAPRFQLQPHGGGNRPMRHDGPGGLRGEGLGGPRGPGLCGLRGAEPRGQVDRFHQGENEGRTNWQQEPSIDFTSNDPQALFQFQAFRNQTNGWRPREQEPHQHHPHDQHHQHHQNDQHQQHHHQHQQENGNGFRNHFDGGSFWGNRNLHG